LDREKEAAVIKKDEEKIDQEEKAVCYANERKEKPSGQKQKTRTPD